jgi:SAM-dependent methyltransferase
MTFFDPTPAFARWLVAYAAGRPIIDVGCGDGRSLERLAGAGCRKFLGVDPAADGRLIRRFARRGVHVVPMEAERFTLIGRPGHLFVIARPCHSGFAGRVMAAAHAGSEVLYVGLPGNLGRDVPGGFRAEAVPAPYCGEEVVYRVTRSRPPSPVTTGA